MDLHVYSKVKNALVLWPSPPPQSKYNADDISSEYIAFPMTRLVIYFERQMCCDPAAISCNILFGQPEKYWDMHIL